MTHLRAECTAAVAAFRLNNPMTDAQAATMVERIMVMVREAEHKRASLVLMAQSMVRKLRETEVMTDAEALARVHRMVEHLLRND